MITTMPFLLTDLTEKRAGEMSEKAEENGQDRNDDTEVRPCRSMAFSPFGAGAGKKSEPDRLYTADDLARAIDDARRAAAIETESALRSSMANDIEQRRCDMLCAIKKQLELKEVAFEEELARLAAVSHRLAEALAKAVIPRAIERQPLVDITDALKVTMTGLAAAPAIELRLPPSLLESGEIIITDLARDVGFAGEVTTVADPTLSEGDAELRWKNGVFSRRLSCLQAEALKLADRWLQRLPEVEVDDTCALLSAPLKPESAGDLPDQVNETGALNERTV